jgi:acyl transferase domain-containing protein
VGGSGVGMIILKGYQEAIKDGDKIHAIIKSSAINNDGSNKVGYSAPSIQGQAEVIIEAQANADVHPETISYVEAHGTATPLGDPIEVAGLTQAFRHGTQKNNFCGLNGIIYASSKNVDFSC